MADRALTPLGELLEEARKTVLHLSAREAARRAGVSESRWRQVVTGVQTKAGATVPVRPTARTVVAMALAVQVDPAIALDKAGLAVSDTGLAAMLASNRATPGSYPSAPGDRPELQAEIQRIQDLRLPAATRLAMLRALITLHAEVEEEQERRDEGRGFEQAAG